MLEGLEISEVRFSEIPFENSVFRFDAEYFKKNYLMEDKQRTKFKTIYLGEDYFITDGQHGYHEVDNISEIHHLTAKNFKKWFADNIGADRLAKWVDDNNKRSSLKVNDIVLTTRGSVGYCAIVKEEVLPANIDQDVARIAFTKDDRIMPQFLVTYINTKFGQDWTTRNQTGMVQQGLALWRVRELPIPKLTIQFQKKIEYIIEQAHEVIIESNKCFYEAEAFLLETIGFVNFIPSSDPVNIKNFKESFWAAGRLDAEYYQMKYENYLSLIYSYNGGFEILKNACNQKDDNFNPEETKEYSYIELSDIGKSGEIKGCTTAQGKDMPTRARRKVNSNDVVVSSIEGSLDSCALVTTEFDNALCSTGFYVINSDKINSETLLVLFKSGPMQNILKQNCSGTILTAINKTEFQNIPVPLIDKSVQEIIKQKITESFRLKIQSELLLETAKRAVEIAIEEDENEAIKYIEENSAK